MADSQDLPRWIRDLALTRAAKASDDATRGWWTRIATGELHDLDRQRLRHYARRCLEQKVEGYWAELLEHELLDGAPAPGEKPPRVELAPTAAELTQRSMELRTLQHVVLPVGELALFAGDPATNKSTLAYQAAVDFTQQGGRVLILTEESIEKAGVRRLELMGADLELVHLESFAQFQLDTPGLARLEAYADHGVGLVVVDPLSGWLLDIDTNAEGQVRGALDVMQHVIDRHGLLLVGILHHAKAKGRGAMAATLGSTAFPAMARAHYTFAESLEDPDVVEVACAKLSWGRRRATQRFARSSLPGSDGLLPRLTWLGEGGRSADEMTAGPEGGRKGGRPNVKRDKAAELVRALMADAKPRFKSEIANVIGGTKAADGEGTGQAWGVKRGTVYAAINLMMKDDELAVVETSDVEDVRRGMLILDPRSPGFADDSEREPGEEG